MWGCVRLASLRASAVVTVKKDLLEKNRDKLEKLAQDFVAQWLWFGNSPREEIAIETERYKRLGYTVSDANLRSAALHRIKAGTGRDDGSIEYSTLDAEIAWIEDVIARNWPANREST